MIISYAACITLMLGLAFFAGRQFEHKGYPFPLGFLLCLFASPLIAFILVVWLPDRRVTPKVNPRLLLEIELEKARMDAAARAVKQ